MSKKKYTTATEETMQEVIERIAKENGVSVKVVQRIVMSQSQAIQYAFNNSYLITIENLGRFVLRKQVSSFQKELPTLSLPKTFGKGIAALLGKELPASEQSSQNAVKDGNGVNSHQQIKVREAGFLGSIKSSESRG